MLRPLHFVLFLLAVAFVASTPVPDGMQMAKVPDVVAIEEKAEANDLEADASSWGYAVPWRYNYGGGGGWYGKGGWNGRYYGGNGWYGRGWSGRNYGWW